MIQTCFLAVGIRSQPCILKERSLLECAGTTWDSQVIPKWYCINCICCLTLCQLLFHPTGEAQDLWRCNRRGNVGQNVSMNSSFWRVLVFFMSKSSLAIIESLSFPCHFGWWKFDLTSRFFKMHWPNLLWLIALPTLISTGICGLQKPELNWLDSPRLERIRHWANKKIYKNKSTPQQVPSG